MEYLRNTSNYLEIITLSNLAHMMSDEEFYEVVKTHKRRSNKIYNSEITMTKI